MTLAKDPNHSVEIARADARAVHTILAALDGSPRAKDVFDVAAKFARRFGARLVLLRVVETPEAARVSAESPCDALPADVVTTALHDLAAIAGHDLFTTASRVRGGVAWKVIVDTSEEERADLVVIGSHRYRGLEHVLGSTERSVVSHSARSVYVVHANA